MLVPLTECAGVTGCRGNRPIFADLAHTACLTSSLGDAPGGSFIFLRACGPPHTWLLGFLDCLQSAPAMLQASRDAPRAMFRQRSPVQRAVASQSRLIGSAPPESRFHPRNSPSRIATSCLLAHLRTTIGVSGTLSIARETTTLSLAIPDVDLSGILSRCRIPAGFAVI